MKENIIYIKQDEEITSIVDRLIKAAASELFLVIPKNSAIALSLVNLRLLKREVDNLNKKITIVTQDEALGRLAKKVGFAFSSDLPQPPLSEPDDVGEAMPEETLKEEENDDVDVLKKQPPAEKFEDLLREEKRPEPLSMADIVKFGQSTKGKLLINKTKVAKDDLTQAPAIEKKDESQKIKPAPKQPLIRSYAAESPESLEEKKNFFVDRKEENEARASYFENDNPAAARKNLIPAFSKKIFAVFIAAAIIVAVLVLFFILPRADIKLTARKEKISVDLSVLVDKSASRIDPELGIIPGQLIKLEKPLSGNFQTSGEKQLNDKATGQVRLYNAYSSSPQTLVATTRLMSSDGKIFRLTKTVVIPGAQIVEGKIAPSYLDVDVEADQPGSSYNIGPSDFTIPGFEGTAKYTAFYGKSSKPMTGGSTEKIKILTQEDFNRARDSLWNGAQEEIKQELIDQAYGTKLLDDFVQIDLRDVKSSVNVGDKADSFTLSIRGVAQAVVFSESDIAELAKNKIKEQLSDNKKLNGEPTFIYTNPKVDLVKGQMSFNVRGEQEVAWKVDEEQIKKLVAGKTEDQLRQILSGRQEIQAFEVTNWPFKKTPSQESRIKITVD